MDTQLVTNINSELKVKAMKMAKEEGLTMKALLSFLLKGYVEKEIQIGAKLSNFKRDYGNLELEELTDDEFEIINSSAILKNAPKELSNLLKEKGV